MTWWTDYQARRGQDRKTLYVNNSKNLISTEFKNSTSYSLVKINGVDRKSRIVEESSIIKNPNRKRLLCFPDETINVGETVEFDGSNWICVDNDTTSQVSDVGIIEKGHNTLKWKDKGGTVREHVCIIITATTKSQTIDEEKYISLPNGIIKIVVRYTAETKMVLTNQRFIFGNQVYEIHGIDDFSKVINGVGLLELTMKKTEKYSADDMTNRIADNSAVYATGGGSGTGEGGWL